MCCGGAFAGGSASYCGVLGMWDVAAAVPLRAAVAVLPTAVAWKVGGPPVLGGGSSKQRNYVIFFLSSLLSDVLCSCFVLLYSSPANVLCYAQVLGRAAVVGQKSGWYCSHVLHV